MNLIIFGATGMFVKQLVKQSIYKGHHVKAFGRNVFTEDLPENDLLELVRGALFDADEVLQTSANSGTQNELIIQAPATAGDYFVQVESPNNGDSTLSRATRYKLTIERV